MKNIKAGNRIVLISLIVILIATMTVLLVVSCSNDSQPLDRPSNNTGREFTGAVSDIAHQDTATASSDIEPPTTSDQPQDVQLDIMSLQAGTVLNEEQVQQALTKLDACFVSVPIPDDVFSRINGKSYHDNPDVGLDGLRYVKLLHYNFEHALQVGELIIGTDLESDYLGIFKELLDLEYEIFSMHLVDNYWTGDATSTDSASIRENNSSAFCYREITWGGSLSNHAFGRAIDINPLQNPYVTYNGGAAQYADPNAAPYIDRSTGLPHVITHEDIAFQVFIKYGFEWGGDWSTPKDYQHFDKQG